METLDVLGARRLALAQAGLLAQKLTGLPTSVLARARRGGEQAQRQAAHVLISHFGYLQLDTVSIAGARSHAIVLLSRLEGFDATLAEELLQPGEPLFEYWGHEASWIPLELYATFAFRRRDLQVHPWWGDVLTEHAGLAEALRRRVREEGPLRSADLEGEGGAGFWQLKDSKRVANALWSAGELAIRERRNFQRSYDLTERVIPSRWRRRDVPQARAIEDLLLRALQGHGWATMGTLASTWRLRRRAAELKAAMQRLEERGAVVACALEGEQGERTGGWIRPADLELAARLRRLRPRQDHGVLLSPFDPLLWDRPRVAKLFAFDQLLEIFKPAAQRKYGYYCLPVLAGERLIARVDFKADRRAGQLKLLSLRFEASRPSTAERAAVASAMERYASAVALKLLD